MRRQTFLLIFFLFSFFVQGQNKKFKNLIGLYGECDNGYFVCKQIELNADSTFVYAQFFDVGGWQTFKGNWRENENGTIFLNLFDKYEYKANSTVEKYNPNQDFTEIKVQMIDSPLGKAEIRINGDSTYILGEIFGEIQIPKTKVNFVEIMKISGWTDCGLEQYYFKIQNPEANDITIISKPYNLYHRMNFLDNYEIKIGNGKLYYWHKTDGRFDKSTFLRKTKIENRKYK